MDTPTNDPEKSIFPGLDLGPLPDLWATPNGCGCWTCVAETVRAANSLSMPFIVCPDCGNKRCPKAAHHDKVCTGSNDVGQKGSRFE